MGQLNRESIYYPWASSLNLIYVRVLFRQQQKKRWVLICSCYGPMIQTRSLLFLQEFLPKSSVAVARSVITPVLQPCRFSAECTECLLGKGESVEAVHVTRLILVDCWMVSLKRNTWSLESTAKTGLSFFFVWIKCWLNWQKYTNNPWCYTQTCFIPRDLYASKYSSLLDCSWCN